MEKKKTETIIRNFTILIVSMLITCRLSLFTVFETNIALISRFGKLEKVYDTPGLKFKVPLIDKVSFIEKRILETTINNKELISLDQKRVVINGYAKYKITSPRDFYVSLRSVSRGEAKINSIAESSLRQVIAKSAFLNLLNENRGQIMIDTKELISKQVADYGIEIKDIRIIKAELPAKNTQMVFERMRSERERESKMLRAEGEERSISIRAEADLEVEKIKSDAKKKAIEIVAKAESEAMKNYVRNCSSEPELLKLILSIKAKKESINEKDKIIIDTDNPILG